MREIRDIFYFPAGYCRTQLNRQAEDQTTPPDLRHLRESGAIEQDADLVLMIHRPERHHILVDEKLQCSTKGMGILSVAKHRNGSTGRIYYSYNPSMSHITAFKPSTFSEEEIANHNELAEQAKNSRNAKPETQYCFRIPAYGDSVLLMSRMRTYQIAKFKFPHCSPGCQRNAGVRW